MLKGQLTGWCIIYKYGIELEYSYPFVTFQRSSRLCFVFEEKFCNCIAFLLCII